MVLGDAHSYPDRTTGHLWEGTAPSCAWDGLDYILSIFSPTCTRQLWGDLGKECVFGGGEW